MYTQVSYGLDRPMDCADQVQGMSNTSDFVLKKEDHTLGNLLSEHLKMHPNVYMAGYKRMFLFTSMHDSALIFLTAVGHPNVPELFIRVQTDGVLSPRDVFTSTCEKLIQQLDQLHQEFTREWELRRITMAGEQGNMQNGA